VQDGIVLLGTNTLRALVLTAEAFAKFSPRPTIDGFSIAELQLHSTLVASVAGAIVPAGPERQDALTAGLLHDIGMLVLAGDDPRERERVIAMASSEQLPLHAIERREHGVTHADVGAYLLTLWGLPLAVVEAVAYHDEPSQLAEPSFDATAAVHIANALVHEQTGACHEQPAVALVEQTGACHGQPAVALLDQSYVERLGVSEQLPAWRELAVSEVRAAVDAGALPGNR
jgi:HD-like signal output (HDOD) protein